jgi:hypothetical protein
METTTPTDPEPPQPGQQHLHWPRQARPVFSALLRFAA